MKLTLLLASFLAVIGAVIGSGVERDIEKSVKSASAMDFLQPNDTVLAGMDMLYDRHDWDFLQKYGLEGQENKRISKRDLERMRRKGIKNKRWVDGVVPFDINPGFSDEDLDVIESAIAEYHKFTCIKFTPADAEKFGGMIYFTNGEGCSSFVGRMGRPQPVTLAPGCRHKGVVIHELGHALGLHHEQTRPDRDEYVAIQHDNMIQGVGFNFQKYNKRIIPDWGVKYDYTSVMHYGGTAFSKNGKPTILAKQEDYQNKMGNRKGFSYSDIQIINLMYKCNAKCTPKLKCPDGGYQGVDCKCYCPGTSTDKPVVECEGQGEVITNPEPEGGDGGGEGECKDTVEGCCNIMKGCKYTYGNWPYMARRCKKTCGFCDGKDTEPKCYDAPHPGGYGTKDKCRDLSSNCEEWSYKCTGANQAWQAYMKSSCSRTCGFCKHVAGETEEKRSAKRQVQCGKEGPTGSGNCKDKVDDCSTFRDKCRTSSGVWANYVRQHCKFTCEFCRTRRDVQAMEPVPENDEAPSQCEDRNIRCAQFAKNDGCQKHSVFMSTFCRKTCNACDKPHPEIPEGCVDTSDYCKSASERGECTTTPDIMNITCKKSCGKC